MERRETVGQRPLLLSNFFAAGGKSTGSKLPPRMEKGVSEFFLSAVAVDVCRIGGTLAAVLTLVMVEG